MGGGDSRLVDFLLIEGSHDITVLDISEPALQRAKKRLGDLSDKVTWIVSDITDFEPPKHYDFWHDRATFHFLTSEDQIERYLGIATQFIKSFLIVSTFSSTGPTTCSGLQIKQYSETELENRFSKHFTKIRCTTEDHIAPSGTKQSFVFCSFKVKK